MYIARSADSMFWCIIQNLSNLSSGSHFKIDTRRDEQSTRTTFTRTKEQDIVIGCKKGRRVKTFEEGRLIQARLYQGMGGLGTGVNQRALV